MDLQAWFSFNQHYLNIGGRISIDFQLYFKLKTGGICIDLKTGFNLKLLNQTLFLYGLGKTLNELRRVLSEYTFFKLTTEEENIHTH